MTDVEFDAIAAYLTAVNLEPFLHDPALATRRLRADRKIFAEHEPRQDGTGFPDGLQCRTCSRDGGDGYQYLVPYPCPTIVALAEAYGIHVAEERP
ncbi:hypothetical protein LT966_21955 [Streptomyces griseobrunneus]